jgi:hypothetical protein
MPTTPPHEVVHPGDIVLIHVDSSSSLRAATTAGSPVFFVLTIGTSFEVKILRQDHTTREKKFWKGAWSRDFKHWNNTLF